ncbi:MAG: RNA polymerase sigma factor RpoD/SigA [Candidatus Pacebacteria bacterium]|nr:RNA polymerase sigma factor RpoD/SigA [Candidatus Paceibacterota bacterium]
MRQLKISKQFTNRDARSLDVFFNEMSKTPRLSCEEEISLTQRIRDGDHVALEKLVTSNLRFVVSVAKQYQNQGLSLGDLINEGSIGLTKAAQKFDETRGFKFISYAVWWIRQSIIAAIVNSAKMIRQPLNKVVLGNKINAKTGQLGQELGREPSDEEIMEYLDIDKESFNHYLESAKHLSLDSPISEEGDITILDTIDNQEESPDSILMKESLSIELKRVINKSLNEKEKEVLIYYYGLDGNAPLRLEDIAKRMKITREGVRQIKERSLRKLGKHTYRKKLISYL